MAASSFSAWMTTCLYCLHLTAHGRFLATRIEDEDFEALCSRKCRTSPEDPSGLPLYQCSCSKSCTVYDDCCYDSAFRNTRESLDVDFICLSVVKRGEFHAVVSCPPYQRSDTCRDALGHLPPVTSRTTNITYGNVFCASCNGDGDDLITWSVQLRCPSDGEEGAEEPSSVVHDSDGFWKVVDDSRTPCRYHEDEDWALEGLELRPCGSPDIISKCSPSWKELELAEKCRSYEDPVYFHNTAYRNVHCAECNFLAAEYYDCLPSCVRNMLQVQVQDPRVFEYCQRRGSEDCLRSLPEAGRVPGSTMSGLFDFRDSTPAYGEKCCPNERPHPRTGKCRKVRPG